MTTKQLRLHCPNEAAEKVESDSVPSSLAVEIRKKAKELDEDEQSLTRFHNLLRKKNDDQYTREIVIVAREEAVGVFSRRFIQGEKKKPKPRKAKQTRATKDGPFTAGEIFPVKLASGPEADRKIEEKKIALRERKRNEALNGQPVGTEGSAAGGGQISGLHEIDLVPEGLERLREWIKSELGESQSDNPSADTNSPIVGPELSKLTKEKLAEVFEWFLAQREKALRGYEKEVKSYNQLVIANERNIVERETAVAKLEETAARVQEGEEGGAGGGLMEGDDVDGTGLEDEEGIPKAAMGNLGLSDEAR